MTRKFTSVAAFPQRDRKRKDMHSGLRKEACVRNIMAELVRWRTVRGDVVRLGIAHCIAYCVVAEQVRAYRVFPPNCLLRVANKVDCNNCTITVLR
jgi:hypothetical protein